MATQPAALATSFDPLELDPAVYISIDLLAHLRTCERLNRPPSLTRLEHCIFGKAGTHAGLMFWRDAAKEVLIDQDYRWGTEPLTLLYCLFATMPVEDVIDIRNWYLDTYGSYAKQETML